MPLQSPAADAPVHRAPQRGGRIRHWLAIDERPAWITFAGTPAGRVSLFAAFGAMLLISLPLRATIVVLGGAAAAAFLRVGRDRAVLAATLLVLLLDPTWYMDAPFLAYLDTLRTGAGLSIGNMQRLLTAAFFGFAAIALSYVARHPQSFFARRPVLSLLGGLAIASAALVVAPPGAASLWVVLTIKLVAIYMWFLCYAVVDQRSPRRGSLTFSLGLIRPFWGSSSTPIGKGIGYLAKLRCDEPGELAVLQLKALKLLAWALVLQAISTLLSVGAARAGVPPFGVVVDAFVQGRPEMLAVGWVALILAVAIGALELAAWGHRVVACARLAGWNLRRNTYRPLQSRTLADFWNRYYYYFKELLLDFFFYPTFFRVFKRRPRLRTFCATFMAAGVGNAIYHFVRDLDRVFSLGPRLAIEGYGSYLFYCLALATGIAASQVRTEKKQPLAAGALGRLRSFACVWGFVTILHVFGGIEGGAVSFADRWSFLAYQFGF